MFGLFNKRDLIAEGLEVFRQNTTLEKLYLLIFRTSGESFAVYGELITSRDLEVLTGHKVDYLNQWIFILSFDRRDNEDIDFFYRFEASEFFHEFIEISENRFMIDISPSLSAVQISEKIRTILSKIYKLSKKKTYFCDIGVLHEDTLPNFFDTEITSTNPSDSFVWATMKL